MPSSPSTENYTLGKGIGAFGELQDDGSYLAPIDLGNMPELNMSVDIETLEHFSSRSGVKKKDKSIILSTSPMISFILDEISPRNMALHALGDRTTVTQALAEDATKAVASSAKGSYYNLGKREVSSVVAATYVENTDFIVYANPGIVFIPWTSTIPDETALSFTFDAAACVYDEIKGFNKSETEGTFLYIANNPAGPEKLMLEIWRVVLKPSGDTAYIGDDWMALSYEGEILADETNHPDNPYLKITI